MHIVSPFLVWSTSDYDQVLLEWNGQLDARLAVVGAYFGRDVRDFLDRVVYEAFKDAGQQLEDLYREVTSSQPVHIDDHAVAAAAAKLGHLNNLAYQLSFVMMVRIREGKVGRAAPETLPEPTLSDSAPILIG